MSLSPEMEAAYDSDGFVEWATLKIEFPSRTVRLLDRAGYLDLGGGEIYTGEDDVYGVWATGDEISDGVDSEAPRFQFGLKIPDPAVAQALVMPGNPFQGSPVTVMTGLVDPLTGDPLPGWETEFVGYFDSAARALDIEGDLDLTECDSFSVFEKLMETNEGVKLNGAWHKALHPGELGLDLVVDVEKTLPWGTGGAGTEFSGKGSGPSDWTQGFSPLTRAATRAMGGAGYVFNPAQTWGRTLRAMMDNQ